MGVPWCCRKMVSWIITRNPAKHGWSLEIEMISTDMLKQTSKNSNGRVMWARKFKNGQTETLIANKLEVEVSPYVKWVAYCMLRLNSVPFSVFSFLFERLINFI